MKFSIKCFFRKCDQTHKKTAVLTKFTSHDHKIKLINGTVRIHVFKIPKSWLAPKPVCGQCTSKSA